MENIYIELLDMLIVVIASCVGIATKSVVSFLKKKGIISKLQSEKEIVKIVVNAVEQIYKEASGSEKLEVAKKEAVKLANQKGIKVTEEQLETLIESSVREMKKEVKQEIKK